MKLWDIARKLGGAAIQTALPGTGSLIVGAVNEFLPEGKKLGVDATGDEVRVAISRLPPEQQVQIAEKQFNVEIATIQERHSTVRAALEADRATPHTTRPHIAKGAFYVIAFTITVVVSAWAYGVATKDAELVTTIMDGWQFILAVIGPLVSLLWAYFGILKTESRDKLNAAGGNAAGSVVGAILGKVLQK